MVPVLMSNDAPGPRDPQNLIWSMVSYTLAGILVWGGAGWLVDRWVNTDVLFTTIGILLGCGLGTYLGYLKVTRS
jgi:ATP synthase protein I